MRECMHASSCPASSNLEQSESKLGFCIGLQHLKGGGPDTFRKERINLEGEIGKWERVSLDKASHPEVVVNFGRQSRLLHLKGNPRGNWSKKSPAVQGEDLPDLMKLQMKPKAKSRKICSVCGKSFSHNLNLKWHWRTHTGEAI